MKMIISSTVAVLSLTAWQTNAFAAESDLHAESDFGLVAELGYEIGGDEIANIHYTDGSDLSVDSGQGVTLALGMHYRPAAWDVDFSGTIGYKLTTTSSSDAAIQIDRTVLQLLATYNPKDTWWLAGGAVWHNNVKFHGDGFGANLDLGSAQGFTLQAGWKWFGLTYTTMEYTEETTGRHYTVDANAIGLVFRWKG